MRGSSLPSKVDPSFAQGTSPVVLPNRIYGKNPMASLAPDKPDSSFGLIGSNHFERSSLPILVRQREKKSMLRARPTPNKRPPNE